MRVLLFGDSHMSALGPRLTRSLEPHGIEVVEYVSNRGKSTRWYAEESVIRDKVIQHRPDAVVFELSGNDMCWGATRAHGYAEEVVRQADGVPVVWVGPPSAARADVDERHVCSTENNRTFAAQRDIPFVDLRPLTPRTGHTSDQVHFTRAGYDQMAQALASPLAVAIKNTRGDDASLVPIVGAGVLLLVAVGAFYATVSR